MATAKYTLRRRGSANSKGSDGRSRSYLFVDGWVCDVCKVAEFEDFEEAQRHEESCCGFNSDPNGDDKAKSNEHSKASAGIKKTHPFFTQSTTSAVKKANALKARPSSAPVMCESNVRRITRSSTKENTTITENIAPIFISKRTSRSVDKKQREQLKILKEDETLSKNIQRIEQRTAEYMAKRKLEQEQDALRRAATKRLKIVEETAKSDSHREMDFSEQVQPWLHKNAAPLFPVPSHFIPSSCNSNTASYDGACSSVTKNISWKPKLKHRSQTTFTPRSGSQSLLYTASEGCFIYDTTHKKTSLLHDAFQLAFSQIFKNFQDQSPCIPRQDLNQLLQLTPENVCGEVNKDACKELLGYLKEWQQYYSMIKRRQAVTTKPKIFSKQQCKKSKYVDDFDTDDSFDEDDEGISHVLLLLGPTGCGKTQLVHACASSLKNCHVLEINTSIPRGGTSLRRIMEEATQSQSLFLSSSSQQYMKAGSHKGEPDNNCSAGNDESTHGINSSSCCMPVLLLDEVDILFEDDGDSGFWPAFKQLCKKAKVPIILTATDTPCSLLSLNNSINNSEMNNCSSLFRFQKVYLERPSAEECTEYLMVKLYDMIQYKRSEKQTEEKQIRKALSTVSQLLNCDIRRCLLEMLTEYNSFQKGNNKRPHHHFHATVVSGKAFTKIRYHIPSILDVQPKEVSSTKSTIIKIVGSDFLHLQQQNTLNNFEEQNSYQSLMIGGKCCPFIILRDDLIYALCPPCQLPNGVDEFGAFKNSLENCLSCSCPVIAFDLNPSKYWQFISMQQNEHDNETASFPFEQQCITNLRYIFPDMGDRLDKMKKERQDMVFRRKNKMMHDDHLKKTLKEKKNVSSEYIELEVTSALHDQEIPSYGDAEKEVSPLKGSKSVTFYNASNSADEDQADSSLESSEKHSNTIMSANMAHTPSLEVAAPKQLNGVLSRQVSLAVPSLPSFQETEWKSQRKMLLKAAADDGLESPEDIVRAGVTTAEDFRSPGRSFSNEELCCLEELSHRCELASVAELIDEYNSAIVPDLAGAVPGFGFDLIGSNNRSGQLTLGRNSKPPDFDRLYSNSWADRAFFHGCSESYFRRPTTTYERRLLSEASYRRSNTPPSKIGKTTDNQRVSNLDEGDAFLPSYRNNEDLFLPMNETGPLVDFPNLVRSSCLWAVEGCSTPIDNSVLEALLHFKRLRRSKELVSKELKSLFPDEALMSCYLSGLSRLDLFLYQDSPPCKGPGGYIDRRMTLDLFPLLRKIAIFEELKQCEHSGQLDVGGDEYKGRTTRARKKNGPTHYFTLCASSIEENDAKRLGANLVKLALN